MMGPGEKLFLAGTRAIGAVVTSGLARWDGMQWSVLGPFDTVRYPVGDVTQFDDGTGAALYIAWQNSNSSSYFGSVSKWNGTAWVQVGGDFTTVGANSAVGTLFVFNDGSGAKLYASGGFDHVGAAAASSLARWNGTAWEQAFGGVSGQINGAGPGAAALVLNGDLYLTGHFTAVGATPTPEGVAQLSQGVWTGLAAPAVGHVGEMRVFDPGSGPIIVGNTNTFPNPVYRLDHTGWVPYGPPCPVGFGPLAGFNLGTGPKLYTSGSGVVGTARLFRLTGSEWEAVVPGLEPYQANEMVMYDSDGAGARPEELWAAGIFTLAGGLSSKQIGRFLGCAGVCYANCDGSTASPVLNVNDFVCFSNHFGAGDPDANCDESVIAPVLNVADFICFMNRYAAGCP